MRNADPNVGECKNEQARVSASLITFLFYIYLRNQEEFLWRWWAVLLDMLSHAERGRENWELHHKWGKGLIDFISILKKSKVHLECDRFLLPKVSATIQGLAE